MAVEPRGPLTSFGVVALLLSMSMLALVKVPSTAQAATQVIWDSDKVLTSDFVVAQDEELIIQSGVLVEFDPGVRLTVYGNITARGTDTDNVYFSWNSIGNEWEGIYIWNASRRSHFHHIWLYKANWGIHALNSNITVEDSNISNCHTDGVRVINGDVSIINTTFVDNGIGTMTESAIYLSGASGLVEGNRIMDNHHGIFLKEGSTVTIRDNDILDSDYGLSHGILMRSGTTSLVELNNIARNHFGITSNASSPIIRNNTIEDNEDDGIWLVNGDTATIRDNTIRQNGDDGVEVNNGSSPSLISNGISGNIDKGVQVWDASLTMTGNDIHHNTVGVMSVDEGTNITSSYNTVHDNMFYGLMVYLEGAHLRSIGDIVEDNADAGLYNEGGTADIISTTIRDNPTNVRALSDSYTYFENGTVSGATNKSFNLTDSRVTTLNLTCDSWSTTFNGLSGKFTKKWYLGVKVITKDGSPFPNVNVSLEPGNMDPPVNGTTDTDGELNWVKLIQQESTFSHPLLSQRDLSPYTVNVSYGGFSNATTVVLDMSRNVTIMLDIPNLPPSLKTNIPDRSIPEDTDSYNVYQLTDHFQDDSAMTFDIVYEEDPTKVDGVMNGTSLDFLLPTENWFGVQRFRVKATDTEGQSTESNTFSINVTPVNDPPTMGPMEAQSVYQGDTLTFKLSANDVDDPASHLTFKSDDIFIPEITVTLDPGTGAVTFRYDLEIDGPVVIDLHFYACDPGPLCSKAITVSVTVLPKNQPPVLSWDPDLYAYVDMMYIEEITIFDPDGDPLSLVLEHGPTGMVLNGTTLLWTPGVGDLGQHLVMLNLSDGHNQPVFNTTTITVRPENNPPEASILSPLDASVFEEGTAIGFSGRAFDLDFDPLSYTWKVDGGIVSHDLGFSKVLGVGTHKINFSVSDGKVEAFKEITITVKKKGNGGNGTPGIGPTDTSLEESPCLWLFLMMAVIIVVSVVVTNVFKRSGGPHHRPRGTDDEDYLVDEDNYA